MEKSVDRGGPELGGFLEYSVLRYFHLVALRDSAQLIEAICTGHQQLLETYEDRNVFCSYVF